MRQHSGALEEQKWNRRLAGLIFLAGTKMQYGNETNLLLLSILSIQSHENHIKHTSLVE